MIRTRVLVALAVVLIGMGIFVLAGHASLHSSDGDVPLAVAGIGALIASVAGLYVLSLMNLESRNSTAPHRIVLQHLTYIIIYSIFATIGSGGGILIIAMVIGAFESDRAGDILWALLLALAGLALLPVCLITGILSHYVYGRIEKLEAAAKRQHPSTKSGNDPDLP